MKLTPQKEVELAHKLCNMRYDTGTITVSIHPTFLSLAPIAHVIENSSLLLGAQDCFFENQGAYTGEISPLHLKEIGCLFCIIGHSERRTYAGETSALINKKLHALIDNRVTPILCVGESTADIDEGRKDHVVRRHIELALEGISLAGNDALIVAYEPVWAIGTGRAAEVQDIVYMHKVIYQTLIDMLPHSIVEKNTHIVYGGSVDVNNIEDLLRNPHIHGVLVGSASINGDQFMQLVEKSGSVL